MSATVNSYANRLKSKFVKNSIINTIIRNFNLTPIAEAYFIQKGTEINLRHVIERICIIPSKTVLICKDHLW
jgi:hypothetical protein